MLWEYKYRYKLCAIWLSYATIHTLQKYFVTRKSNPGGICRLLACLRRRSNPKSRNGAPYVFNFQTFRMHQPSSAVLPPTLSVTPGNQHKREYVFEYVQTIRKLQRMSLGELGRFRNTHSQNDDFAFCSLFFTDVYITPASKHLRVLDMSWSLFAFASTCKCIFL